MKKQYKLIAIISLAILILLGIFFVLSIKERQSIGNPVGLPQIERLPYENDHFRVTYQSDNSLLLVPKIPFESEFAPSVYFVKYWDQYEIYAKEALVWLEENGLGKNFREKFGVNIEWWGSEWWPQGKTIE